jgi:hypothetical protein
MSPGLPEACLIQRCNRTVEISRLNCGHSSRIRVAWFFYLSRDMGRSHLVARLPKRCRRCRLGHCCRAARVYTHTFRVMFIQSLLLDVALGVAQ